MRFLIIVGLVVTLLSITGCATIFTGTNANILVSSTPKNATFVVKSDQDMEVGSGTTPSSVRIKKGKEYIVEISLEGYQTKTVFIDKEFNIVTILNLQNIVGWAIDFISGAAWNPSPKFINVTLLHASIKGEDKLYCNIGTYEQSKLVQLQSVEMNPIQP